ncbi:MAG: dockerin type I domain-containing protein [Planctomycetota bacterium]
MLRSRCLRGRLVRHRLGRYRRLTAEHLQSRALLAGDGQIAVEHLDVNDDLRVTALDALQVINWVDQVSNGLPAPSHSHLAPDVNGDGSVTALDALLVINRLSRSDEISLITPIEDTAPGGGTNRDRITKVAGIRGVIRLPKDLSEDASVVSLRIQEFERDARELSLEPYRNGNRFDVPSFEMEVYHDGRYDSRRDPQPTLVELVVGAESEPLDQRRVLAELQYTLDQQPPLVELPRTFLAGDSSVPLTAIDASGLAITQDTIQWQIDGEHYEAIAADLVKRTGNQTDFALTLPNSLTSAELSSLDTSAEGIALRVQAELEDQAGNRHSFDLRHFIDRADPIDLPKNAEFAVSDASVFDDWSSVQPDRGYGFEPEVATVRAGQQVKVAIPDRQAVFSLHQDVWFNDVVRPTFIESTWNEADGTLEF